MSECLCGGTEKGACNVPAEEIEDGFLVLDADLGPVYVSCWSYGGVGDRYHSGAA